MLWVLLAVYAKTNYQIPENQFGWLPIYQRVVVRVSTQYFVTLITRRYRPLPVAAVGMFIYAVGVEMWH